MPETENVLESPSLDRKQYCDRDENGWRVPRTTFSRRIYDLAKAGVKPRQIAKELGCDANMVRVLIHRMSHPEITNARTVLYNKTGTANPQRACEILGLIPTNGALNGAR